VAKNFFEGKQNGRKNGGRPTLNLVEDVENDLLGMKENRRRQITTNREERIL
jgi:hypothetical protein